MNPLFNAINNNLPNNIPNQQLNDLRSMYQLFKSKGNPMMVFNQLTQNNPQMKQILELVRQGHNPQELFYNLCNQRGINPQTLINQITGGNNN